MTAVATAAACVFLVVLTLLAAQLRAGHDPGLGTVVSPVAAKHTSASAQGHGGTALVTKSSGGG